MTPWHTRTRTLGTIRVTTFFGHFAIPRAKRPLQRHTSVFKQFEILLEGMNHEASGPLTDLELSRVRSALQPGEHLCSFVRGRIVGAGTGLWVLTEQRVVRLQDGRRRNVDTLPLAQVQEVSLQAGRYGHTVAIAAAGQRLSIFAADAGLARAFVAAVARSLPPGASLSAGASATTAAYASAMSAQSPTSAEAADIASAAADVATWVTWSRLRLQPTPHQGMAENLMLLREAATLHERGMLNDAEYGALKERLLEAA